MERLKVGLGIVVPAMWVVGYAVSWITGSEPPVEITYVVGALVTGVFGVAVFDAGKRKDGGDDGS